MARKTLNIFTQHSRNWLTNRYVYPVISRRSKGLSIGINLNPDKACNFDCVYCSVDRTVSPVVRKVELPLVRQELDAMLAMALSGELYTQEPMHHTPPELRRLNDVAFSGDGEPTAYPKFGEVCRLAAELLHKHGQDQVKIVVITNATLLHRPAVVEALRFLDQHHGEVWAKLEAGTEEYYHRVERTRVSLKQVLANILSAGRQRPIVIQSLFMRLHGKGPSNAEIAAYVERLKELKASGCRIKVVQVYTTARLTAERYVTPLESETLDHIAAQVRDAGLAVETYYGVQ